MAHATLTLTIPEGTWLRRLSRTAPDATLEVLAAVRDGDAGFALVRVTGPGVDDALERLADVREVAALTVVRRDDDAATVHFESVDPFLLFLAEEGGSPIELPVRLRDGEATVDVRGPRERLADLVDRLERAGMAYGIDRVHEGLHERQLLSDRQLEVIATAVEEGYYDTPRRCSLTELAAHLDIAKSTCSETLHRAEEAVVKQFVAGAAEAEADLQLADRLEGDRPS